MRRAVACPPVDDGCGPVASPEGVISGPGGRFRLWLPAGAQAVIGRWQCADPLPAVLNLETGAVWIFRAWPSPGHAADAQLVSQIVDASALEVRPQLSGCDLIQVYRHRQGPVVVAPGRGVVAG